jgi:hypothetical protein
MRRSFRFSCQLENVFVVLTSACVITTEEWDDPRIYNLVTTLAKGSHSIQKLLHILDSK